MGNGPYYDAHFAYRSTFFSFVQNLFTNPVDTRIHHVYRRIHAMKHANVTVRITKEAKKLLDRFRIGRETQGDVVLRALRGLEKKGKK